MDMEEIIAKLYMRTAQAQPEELVDASPMDTREKLGKVLGDDAVMMLVAAAVNAYACDILYP